MTIEVSCASALLVNIWHCLSKGILTTLIIPDADGGHQPSTNVYVHPVDSTASLNYLGPFYDLGEDILGTSKTTQRYNIASAAFSIDEQRLLMVGEDGVVVVRNLHLDELSIKGQHSAKEIYLPTTEEAEDAETILTF